MATGWMIVLKEEAYLLVLTYLCVLFDVLKCRYNFFLLYTNVFVLLLSIVNTIRIYLDCVICLIF